MAAEFWKVKAVSEEEGEVLIYGTIGDASFLGMPLDDVSSRRFAEDLKVLGDVSRLTVRINSPGGEVFAAQAIHATLKRHRARVKVYVDGMAASAASLVAMAGDEVVMARGAMMMIHSPVTCASGDAGDMRNVAEILDRIRDSMVTVYCDRTGLGAEEVRDLLENETWMTAEEAVERGFADRVEGGEIAVAAVVPGRVVVVGSGAGRVRVDLSVFRTPPEAWKSLERRIREDRPDDTEAPATEKDGKEVEDMTPEELKAKYPDLVKALSDEAAVGERARIEALKYLAAPGNDKIIAEAIASGATAEATALKIVRADRERLAAMQEKRKEDASALAGIRADGSPGGAGERHIVEAIVKGAGGGKRGGEKR